MRGWASVAIAVAVPILVACGGGTSPAAHTTVPPGGDVNVVTTSLPTAQSSKYVTDITRTYPQASRAGTVQLINGGEAMCAELQAGVAAPQVMATAGQAAIPAPLVNAMFAAAIADICPQDASAALAQIPTTTTASPSP